MKTLSLAFTLIAIIGAMFLLAKSKKENLGKFFTRISYLLLVIGFLSASCIIYKGCCRVLSRTGICTPENCWLPGCDYNYDQKMNNSCCMPGTGHRRLNMKGCCEMKDKWQCGMMGDDEDDNSESADSTIRGTDTIVRIRKEIRVEKDSAR